jgi:hypothetical protein
MTTNRIILIFVSFVLLVSLVGCKSSNNPVQTLQNDGYVLSPRCSTCYTAKYVEVDLRSDRTDISENDGFDELGLPPDPAGIELTKILTDLYGIVVTHWVFNNLPTAAANLAKSLTTGSNGVSCGDTDLKGSSSGYTITISMNECYPLVAGLTISIAPPLITTVAMTALVSTNTSPTLIPTVSEETLSILKADAFSEVENNSTFYCPDGCNVLNNQNIGTSVALYNNGKIVFGIQPLGTALLFTDDQLNTLGSILGKIYGPDMTDWFQKTSPTMKNQSGYYNGDITDTVDGNNVEIFFASSGDTNQNMGTITIIPPTKP